MTRQLLFGLAIVTVLSWSVGTVLAATIAYDFDDGTLQGWTQVMSGGSIDRGDAPSNGQTQGIFRFDVVPNSELLSNTTTQGAYLGAGAEPSHDGDYRILPKPFYDRDSNNSTLLLRSPEFYLDGSGDLTAQLRGGDEDNAPPATSALVPSTTSGSGFQGVALRRASDDTYILYDGRSSNGSNWQQITFLHAALATHVSGSETYTLDFIDNARGGWGWVALDTVSVPGVPLPEPSTLALAAFGLFGLAAWGWRRRR